MPALAARLKMCLRFYKGYAASLRLLIPATASALLLTSGCATNPVTGKNEFSLISEKAEIAMGTEHYFPAQQAQGGAYVVDPHIGQYVSKVGNSLARYSHRPNLPYEFVVLNNSVPNAWAMPGGKIAINRGLLLELQSEAELAAVLSHEIVHSAARHSAKAMERAMAMQAMLIGVQAAARDHRDGRWAAAGASATAGMTQLKYSRDAERESDRYGLGYMAAAGYDPRAAVNLQKTFLRLMKGKRSSTFGTLFATHPPSEERIENLEALTSEYPEGGRLGRDEYSRRMAGLHKAAVAYKSYDSGIRALEQGNPQNALNAAAEAIKREKREAIFYGLRGDAQSRANRPKDAIEAFNRAIELHENYFYFHLRKGQLLHAAGRDKEAMTHLNRSIRLLPTADAYYTLGEISKKDGQTPEALEFYRAAAGSNSQAGHFAQLELARMTMPTDPGSYIRTKPGIDRERILVVQIRNTSPLAVRNIVVHSSARSGRWKRQKRSRYAQTLDPGHAVTISTGLGPLPEVDPSRIEVTIEIQSADVVE